MAVAQAVGEDEAAEREEHAGHDERGSDAGRRHATGERGGVAARRAERLGLVRPHGGQLTESPPGRLRGV